MFNVDINNRTNRAITEMSANLVQKIKFHSNNKTKTCIRNVASIKYDQRVSARSTDRWDKSVLLIPPVCSSSNGTCRIIEVSYAVIFRFDASGFAISKDLVIPIVIGTIPMNIEQDSRPPAYTYETCIFGPNPVDIPDETRKGEIIESDSNTFKPYYPYYAMQSNYN